MSVMPVGPSRIGSLGAGKKPGDTAAHKGSLLARPTEASVAHGMSTGSVLSKKGKPRKELTFKQQLLKKTIKGSVMRPSGVMALHIKQGHFHDIDNGGYYFNWSETVAVYLRVHSSSQCKLSGMFVNLVPPVTVSFDELFHFDLTVKPRRQNMYYFLRIEVVAFDLEHPEEHQVLAMKELSQLDLARSRYAERTIELWKLDRLVADLSLEFAFAYGVFGFGYSNLFRFNTLRKPTDLVEYSMLCRVALPKIRTLKADDEVMLCSWDRVQAPELLYVTCNVTFTVDIAAPTGTAAPRRATVPKKLAPVIAEVSENEDEDEDKVDRDADPTPMVTALLRPRMLELRAAYSQQVTRRKRLEWLHDHGVVGGAEARIHGERLHIEHQQPLRRLLIPPDPRPAELMGVRPSDRREDELAVLAGVVRPGTTLLLPPSYDDDGVDDDKSSSLSQSGSEWKTASRTLNNWTGMTYVSSTTMSPDDLRGRPSHKEP